MTDTTRQSFQEFLEDNLDDDLLLEVEVEYKLAQIAGRARKVKDEANLSFRTIADRMGLQSPSVVQRIVDKGDPSNTTVSTLVRFSHACGYDLSIEFKPMQALLRWARAMELKELARSPVLDGRIAEARGW